MKQPIGQAIELLESLPEETQVRVVELLRDLVENARNEARWAELIKRGADLLATVRLTRETPNRPLSHRD